jgi:hypothetical protein
MNMVSLIFTHLIAGVVISAAGALGMAILPVIVWFLDRLRL